MRSATSSGIGVVDGMIAPERAELIGDPVECVDDGHGLRVVPDERPQPIADRLRQHPGMQIGQQVFGIWRFGQRGVGGVELTVGHGTSSPIHCGPGRRDTAPLLLRFDAPES